MPEGHKGYDVAISFLNEDLGLAVERRDLIGVTLDVFVYSAKQEDLAGTDGLISFRRVFRGDARLMLILHRSGWGQTP